MRATGFIVHAPRFNTCLCLGQRGELVSVQTFVAKMAIKRLNKGIFHRFPRSNEVELDASQIGSLFQHTRLELGAMIHCDGARA